MFAYWIGEHQQGSIISDLYESRHATVKELKLNGSIISYSSKLSNAFNDHFSTIGPRLANEIPPHDNNDYLSHINDINVNHNKFSFSSTSSTSKQTRITSWILPGPLLSWQPTWKGRFHQQVCRATWKSFLLLIFFRDENKVKWIMWKEKMLGNPPFWTVESFRMSLT